MAERPAPRPVASETRPARDTGAVLPLRRAAVLIPALNEEEALPAVLGSLPVAQLCAVVVADNGSTDGTARVARAAGAVVVYERTRGYGAACLAGPDYLRSLDPAPEAVVFLDADHPEDARRLSLILSPIGREADLVLGVRVARDGEPGNLHAHARWGNRLVLAAVRLLFGRRSKILRRLGKVAAGGQATTGSSARPQTAPNSSPSQ